VTKSATTSRCPAIAANLHKSGGSQHGGTQQFHFSIAIGFTMGCYSQIDSQVKIETSEFLD